MTHPTAAVQKHYWTGRALSLSGLPGSLLGGVHWSPVAAAPTRGWTDSSS
ncbi:MAG TPA: hypothetical protein VGK53_12585 [Propionicimonas sp.]|jgi:hypothetical protein